MVQQLFKGQNENFTPSRKFNTSSVPNIARHILPQYVPAVGLIPLWLYSQKCCVIWTSHMHRIQIVTNTKHHC